MDPTIIIEDLLDRIKGLTKENAFLKASLKMKEEVKEDEQT